MAHQRLAHVVDEQIAAYIKAHVEPVVDQMPDNSQLARLGTLVRQARATGDVAVVSAAVQRFRSTARHAYQQAYLNGTELWEWITTLLDSPPLVWERLGITTMPTVAGTAADQRPLAENPGATNQAVLQLLAAILVAPARLRKNQMEQHP
jgi:hypothetical protein